MRFVAALQDLAILLFQPLLPLLLLAMRITRWFCTAAFVLLLLGGMALTVLEPFPRCTRQKETECRSNLKSWFSAQRSYMNERDELSEDMHVVDFDLERGNRYAYFASDFGPVQERSSEKPPPPGPARAIAVDTFKYGRQAAISRDMLPLRFAGGASLGRVGRCPNCTITAACAGNIDADPALDIWSVSTAPRHGPGFEIPAGEIVHEFSDREDRWLTEVPLLSRDYPRVYRRTVAELRARSGVRRPREVRPLQSFAEGWRARETRPGNRRFLP